MVRIICLIRPHRLEPVKSAIAALGVSGMTVTDVRGTGNSPGGRAASAAVVAPMPIQSRLEVVVPDDLREAVIGAIIEHARTGDPGDGKIFVERIADAVRVRTGERGETAI